MGLQRAVTRTPDAHWMTEARYRGQKVVVVSPGLRGRHQVRRRVAAPAPRHRRALAMAMGHVILTEFFVRRQVPYFTDYVRRFTDLPLPRGTDRTPGPPGAFVPGKFVTAAALGLDGEGGRGRPLEPVLLDAVSGRRWCPTAPSATAGPSAARAAGTWTSGTWSPS
ncbi:hypothetical protein ACFPC0_10025 [Streptomyces andamanensis]|uniref:Molybdopterin oxidoreductase domain-containing protein n=1 Tax=Streptomyces andamanensis TaxID=1565035 RepID=A0ABV8TC36_9ACTN